MSIIIQKRGVLDTIQDLGRRGYRKFGVNPNGVMDTVATRLINTLLGNEENCAVLEMHFPAPVIEFQEDASIALGGAEFCAQFGKEPIQPWKRYSVRKGSVLSFNEKKMGSRCYLAIEGGFEIENWLGSASTNLKAGVGGKNGRYLISTDKIPFKVNSEAETSLCGASIARSVIPSYSNAPIIRYIKGVEYRNLTALSENDFSKETYQISQNSDRMGFRLEGKSLNVLDDTEIVSTAVNFGTIQLLPSGQLIVLMADHQTTGGYPKIGHIIKQDLPLIAQLGAGDSVRFEVLSIKEAEETSLKFEKDLRFLKMGLRFNSKRKK